MIVESQEYAQNNTISQKYDQISNVFIAVMLCMHCAIGHDLKVFNMRAYYTFIFGYETTTTLLINARRIVGESSFLSRIRHRFFISFSIVLQTHGTERMFIPFTRICNCPFYIPPHVYTCTNLSTFCLPHYWIAKCRIVAILRGRRPKQTNAGVQPIKMVRKHRPDSICLVMYSSAHTCAYI